MYNEQLDNKYISKWMKRRILENYPFERLIGISELNEVIKIPS